jgi:hypothetical protein
MDMDDPTIILQRFVPLVKDFMKENEVSYEIFGCSMRDTEKYRNLCTKHGVTFFKKPVTIDDLRYLTVQQHS